LIKKNVDEGTDEFLAQVSTLKGENTVNVAERIGVGTTDYNLINLDSGSIVDISIKFILFILFLF